MEENKLQETNEDIKLLLELGLPVSLDKLSERKMLETKYLNENVIPQIQSQTQALVGNMHRSFCLLVEYQFLKPVQVRLVEKSERKENVKLNAPGKNTPLSSKDNDAYSSARVKEIWKSFLRSLKRGVFPYKEVTAESYTSLSQLLRVMQSKEIWKYTASLFNALKIVPTGKISLPDFISVLEPEQFVKETTSEGTFNRIVLWTQTQQVETLKDGTRCKIFEADGVTPIMVAKQKMIQEGKWTLKTLCELIAQKEYFASLHSAE